MDTVVIYSPAPGPGGTALVTNNDSGYLYHGSPGTDTRYLSCEIKGAFPWSGYAADFFICSVYTTRSYVIISPTGEVKIRASAGTALTTFTSSAAFVPDGVQGTLKVVIDTQSGGATGSLTVTWDGGSDETSSGWGDGSVMEHTRTGIAYLASTDAGGGLEIVDNLEFLKVSIDNESTYLVDMGPQAASAWNAGTNAGSQSLTVAGTFVDE